jgi:capsular polysaccharide biosynthesis protein
MELRRYWDIVWRRGWIVLALVLLTGLISVNWRGTPPPSYQASFRITVGLTPEERGPATYTYDRYYTWLTSEYIVDSFSELVKSHAFADDVSAYLAGGEQPLTVPAGAIRGATISEQVHRILTITITWGDPDQLAAIANAAVRAIENENAKYFAQLGTEGAHVVVIDPPAVVPVGAGLRERLDLPIRLFLALLAGVALTFLLDYLDMSVRNRADLETLGLDVLGEIPPQPGRRRFPWQRRLP